MRLTKMIMLLAALAAGAVSSGVALAHHGGHAYWRFGINLGFPGYWGYPGYYAPRYYYPPAYYAYPPPYPYPEYYYPPAAGVAPEAPEYMERDAPLPARRQAESSFWYYCPESNGYYPYVRQCPGGWKRVAPLPPQGSGGIER